MAILRSQSPFRVSGSFGDLITPIDPVAPFTTMATMAVHLRRVAPFKRRQWSPMAIVIAIGRGATNRIAICDNGASIGAIYCRHWRQWSIHWRHLLSALAPMAPNDPFSKLSDTFTQKGFTSMISHSKGNISGSKCKDEDQRHFISSFQRRK